MAPHGQKARPAAGIVLSLLFGLLLAAVATSDLFVSLLPDRPLPFTIRIPGIGVFHDTMTSGAKYQYRSQVFPRGATLSPDNLRVLRAIESPRRPPHLGLLIGLALAFTLVFFLYNTSIVLTKVKTSRRQIQLGLMLFLLAVGSKVFLLLTPFGAQWLPLSLLVIPVAVHMGSRLGAATAVAGAMVLSLLTPVDLCLLVVLLAQGLAAALLVEKPARLRITRATIGSMACGGATYLAFALVTKLSLANEWHLQSNLLASVGGGLMGGLLSYVATPVMGRMLGVLSRSRLLELSNLDAPPLKQLASRAPGTWAHSMAMANMAEMAANAISADGLLVRVGAYYHDLGKTSQPEYFIENQEGDNPHNDLPPEVSADAIFSHVTEGLKHAQKHHLPPAVTEFINTHHAGGLLEFFWHKNLESGNPRQLGEHDFRYPGYPPQTREGAILLLCDAVEAASRTLDDLKPKSIQQLVRQITFSKLEQGLLKESGLTLDEFQKVMSSLVETLRSSRHGRIRYPWQEEQAREAGVNEDKNNTDPVEGPVEDEATSSDESATRTRTHTKPLGVRSDGEPG